MARKAVATLKAEIEQLPAIGKPIEQMDEGELLQHTARLALLRLCEIVSQPIDLEADIKERRLIMETAGLAAKLRVHVAITEFQTQRGDRLGEVLERIAKADLSKPT